MICAQLYDFKYSYQIPMICAQIYGFKYSYTIQIICTQLYEMKSKSRMCYDYVLDEPCDSWVNK